MEKKFKFFRQLESLDCGPTCLKMISYYFGKLYTANYLREICYATRSGVSMAGLKEGASTIGLKVIPVKLTYEQLINEAPLPCIIHWKQNHFIIVLKENKNLKKDKIRIADPGFGIIEVFKEDFLKNWLGGSYKKGIALLFETTDKFYTHTEPKEFIQKKQKIRFFLNYLKPFKPSILKILLGMCLTAGINFAFPIITKQLIDKGIHTKDIHLIYLFLLAQLALFTGTIVIDIVRSRLLLYMNANISIKIISDFLGKLMRLPINFFDTKVKSDILLRVDDHSRIEEFLSSSSLNIIFSALNFIVFFVLLYVYTPVIFLIFTIGSSLSIFWILLFVKKRKLLDYIRFDIHTNNRNSLYEIITGMEEIKLNTAEKHKRLEWENIQAQLYSLNKKSLTLDQYQRIGLNFLTQTKNIFITGLAAVLVVQGHISLGVMLSIAYIIGQLNNPIEQLITFFNTAQDASISMDRLIDVYNKKEENEILKQEIRYPTNHILDIKNSSIVLDNISFQYNGPFSPKIFDKLSLYIPHKKITAIVGASGSGKTTLMKLLLKFYEPTEGHISINEENLSLIPSDKWRNKCGAVMQDGYIFSDTIAKNIALSDEKIDIDKLNYASTIANIKEFIISLPLQFNTKIGNAGIKLSMGQTQRLLIARAVYKNPDILFFDEATSSLDANNEKIIMQNLNVFFQDKTVVVIAHRLSTVKNADQIIVLDKGKIVETGTHLALSQNKNHYYELVKNQLELGN